MKTENEIVEEEIEDFRIEYGKSFSDVIRYHLQKLKEVKTEGIKAGRETAMNTPFTYAGFTFKNHYEMEKFFTDKGRKQLAEEMIRDYPDEVLNQFDNVLVRTLIKKLKKEAEK